MTETKPTKHAARVAGQSGPEPMVSSLQPREHLIAMVRALEQHPNLTVTRDDETVIVTVASSGREVFRALEKDAGGAWIVRSLRGLLSLEGGAQ